MERTSTLVGTLVEAEARMCFLYFLIGVSENSWGLCKVSFPQVLFLYNARFVGVHLLKLCFSKGYETVVRNLSEMQ